MIKDLIAPCGMNCGICKFHYRKKNTCLGCRNLDESNPITRFNCIVRECEILKDRKWRYCSDKCENYPCKRLKALDKRYSTKYHMSMIENLEFIRDNGIDEFLKNQKEKHQCSKCGGVICVHDGKCYSCGNQIKIKGEF